MANLLHFTEQFDNAYWTPSNATVTANSQSAPVFASLRAGMGDTLDDQSASQGFIAGTYESCAADTSAYVASIYVRKDAITSRFPIFVLQFAVGATISAGVSFNTSTGAIANADSLDVPDASGVVDVDAAWWRVWVKKANANGTNVRVYIRPAISSTLGGVADGTVTGNIVAWGANLTNTATVQAYEPDPVYVSADVTTLLRAYINTNAAGADVHPKLRTALAASTGLSTTGDLTTLLSKYIRI
jgi:hypothetical protein